MAGEFSGKRHDDSVGTQKIMLTVSKRGERGRGGLEIRAHLEVHCVAWEEK